MTTDTIEDAALHLPETQRQCVGEFLACSCQPSHSHTQRPARNHRRHRIATGALSWTIGRVVAEFAKRR